VKNYGDKPTIVLTSEDLAPDSAVEELLKRPWPPHSEVKAITATEMRYRQVMRIPQAKEPDE
ncbi:MAG TPA: hypothetical protein VFP47_18740, partial [Pyrinomonadaceae bacterium]|nr:hypothetical protein [Pyrinomonadaceae bacterium]